MFSSNELNSKHSHLAAILSAIKAGNTTSKAHEQIIRAMRLQPEFQSNGAWQEQIFGMAQVSASAKLMDRLGIKLTLDEEALQQISKPLQQALESSRSSVVGRLLQQSTPTSITLVGVDQSLKILSSIIEATKKISESNQAVASASSSVIWANCNAIKLTAFRTFEMQGLINGVINQVEASHNKIAENLKPLAISLPSLSSLSARVLEDFSVEPTALNVASRWILESPIVQTYEAYRNVAQLLGTEEETDTVLEEPIVLYRTDSDSLVSKLAILNPDFVDIFLGAKDAIMSQNRDYMRQASVSFRELLIKLLEHLAPDELVKSYSESAKHFQKKETHRARLKYLFREVISGSYAAFIEKDIDIILQTILALNKATHSSPRPFADREMQVLVARIEGNLLMILAVAQP